MVDVLIKLAKAAAEFSTVTEASFYKSGLITIDGVTDDGEDYSIIYRLKNKQENANGNS